MAGSSQDDALEDHVYATQTDGAPAGQ